MMKTAWLVIGACWIVFFIYWIARARNVKQTIEQTSRSSSIKHRVPVILGGILVYSRPWGYPLNLALIPPTDWTVGIGAVICVLGLGVTIWARRTLAGNWSSDVTFKQDHELIQAGPYRLVRHPIYTGLLLMFLGSAIAGGQLHSWLGLLLVSIGFWIKLRMEEAVMLKHFPIDYPSYQRRVKALVPYVI